MAVSRRVRFLGVLFSACFVAFAVLIVRVRVLWSLFVDIFFAFVITKKA